MGLFRKKSSLCETSAAEPLPPSLSGMSADSKLEGSRASTPECSEAAAPPIKVPSIESLPNYISDLASTKNPAGERAARALRKLFAVSEHASFNENRLAMVRMAEGQLVPVLLQFLARCEKGSSEQYLTLLVLNNISIPVENKRLIALEQGGARMLARLLLEDPSCHLIAIILVNLTFCDAELRGALVREDGSELVESLCFALRVGSLTQEEFEHRLPLIEMDPEERQSAKQILAILLAEDQRQRLSTSSDSCMETSDLLPPASKQLFPDTTRWTLAALKNLTRPSKDPGAAHALIQSGIVPLIFRLILVSSPPNQHDTSLSEKTAATEGESSLNSQDDDTPTPAEPADAAAGDSEEDYCNSPTTWDANSAQDAALFIVMNLSTAMSAREYVRESDAVHILSLITASERIGKCNSHPFVEEELLEFQRLKARMALAYLIGSEGHFGQPRIRGCATSHVFANKDDSALIVTEPEVTRLVELLATTLHRRAKEGAGGYSAATFSVKYVLFALRGLLTQYENQVKFSNAQGTQLNTLLLKALAMHSLGNVVFIDEEAAEHAAYSLYLLSNYFLEDKTFLPSLFGHEKPQQSLTAKVLTAYAQRDVISPAGKHAADQLLRRLPYLHFDGTAADLAVRSGSSTTASDFDFEESLIKAAAPFMVVLKAGARPDKDIFNRALLRRRVVRKESSKSHKLVWDHQSTETFPNALQAAQEFSFNSSKVRHLDAIDDVLIANNIVHSANGDKTESYNCIWNWQETAGDAQRNLEPKPSSESFFTQATKVDAIPALSLLDSLCGGLVSGAH